MSTPPRFLFSLPVVSGRSSAQRPAGAAWRALCLVMLGALALGASGAAQAQAAGDPSADLGPLTQRWLDDTLARSAPTGLPLRMEVSVGSLDSRLRLAPCARRCCGGRACRPARQPPPVASSGLALAQPVAAVALTGLAGGFDPAATLIVVRWMPKALNLFGGARPSRMQAFMPAIARPAAPAFPIICP